MLNKAILMGRLTRDPELRHTQSNMAVCSFSLAIDRGRKRERAHSHVGLGMAQFGIAGQTTHQNRLIEHWCSPP